jgi:hypothetical protein
VKALKFAAALSLVYTAASGYFVYRMLTWRP